MKGVQEHPACSAKLEDTVDQRQAFVWGSKSETSFMFGSWKGHSAWKSILLSDNTGCVFGISWDHAVTITGIMCPSSYFMYVTAHPDASPVASGQAHKYLGGLRSCLAVNSLLEETFVMRHPIPSWQHTAKPSHSQIHVSASAEPKELTSNQAPKQGEHSGFGVLNRLFVMWSQVHHPNTREP